MDDEHLFFVAVARELSPDDRCALDQAGIDTGMDQRQDTAPGRANFTT